MTVVDDRLRERRPELLRRWRQVVLLAYPEGTARLLARETDPFSNPMARILREGLEDLYDRVLEGGARGPSPALDRLMHLRALEHADTGPATAFVADLEGILREELAGLGLDASEPDLAELGRRLGELRTTAGELFAASREQLGDLRRRELVRSTAKYAERLQRGRAAGKDP